MDADDIALPERLEKQLAVFTTLPESTVLGSRCLFFTNRHLWGYVNSPESHEAILKRMPLHNEFVHSCVMFNRDFVLRNGGYPTGIYGDFDLWLRLRDKAHFQIVPEPLLFIQYRKISLSRGNMLKQYRRVYALTRPFFADNAILHSFGLTDDEIPVVRGWREYFFGRPNLARYEWKRVLFQNGFKPRLLLAYLITFLPGPLFVSFKENRFRFRLDYFRILRREDRTRYKKLLRHFLN
jgi:hypothetical protein